MNSMSAYAMKIRTSALNRFWRRNISDKNGLGGDKNLGRRPFAAVPKATFSFAMAVMDKVWEGGMKNSAVVSRCVHEIYTKAV